MNVCFLGMSHLGVVSSVVSASKGVQTFCFDKDKRMIREFEKGNFYIEEPNLIKLFKKYRQNIQFVSDLKMIDHKIDLFIISKDIKTSRDGTSELKEIITLLDEVEQHINEDTALVILSQVPPGFTRSYQNKFKNLYYQVETLIFGQAILRSSNPERLIIGVNNDESIIEHSTYLKFLKLYNCPILIMNYESAELTKLCINIYLISSITFANVMDEISSSICANWNDISKALRMDKRIGMYSYIKPGLGLSGGNLERDLKNITQIKKNNKIINKYLSSFEEVNLRKKNFPIKRYKEFIRKHGKLKKISILGVVYKENTNSIKNSPSLNLIKYLKRENNFFVYDNYIKKIEEFPNVKIMKSLKKVLKDTEAVFIMSPLKDFNDLQEKYMMELLNSKLIIDPFRLLKQKHLSNSISYFYN